MTPFTADLVWERGEQNFLDNRYSRRHTLKFDGGAVLAGSSSPHVVPVPYSDPAAIDPEEMFVAAIANCHMLWFLSICVGRKLRVDRYLDRATGVMQKNGQGKLFVSKVVLRPQVIFSADRLPDRHEIETMHHEAHAECFIANSVKSEILCEPDLDGA